MSMLMVAFIVSLLWTTLKITGKMEDIPWWQVWSPVWVVFLVQFMIGFIQGICIATMNSM